MTDGVLKGDTLLYNYTVEHGVVAFFFLGTGKKVAKTVVLLDTQHHTPLIASGLYMDR